jgi:hypothetical protein
MGNSKSVRNSIQQMFSDKMKIVLINKEKNYFFYDQYNEPKTTESMTEYCIFEVKKVNESFFQLVDKSERMICIGDSYDTLIQLEDYGEEGGIALKGVNSGKYLGVSFGNTLVYSDSSSWNTRFFFIKN